MTPSDSVANRPVSRSLLTFLLFVLLLAAGAAALVWWAGPAMVSLALDEDRRTTPYYLLHLLDEAEPGAYFQTFSGLLREEGAQLLWRGSLKSLRAGRSRDELADAALLEFGEGAAVVQMLTSGAYRSLTRDRSVVLLGTPEPPGPIASDETLLLWLIELGEHTDPVVLEGLAGSAAERNGQVVWSSPVAVLAGGRPWNYVILLAFPDTRALEAWLDDPETITERSLSRRYYDAEAMLELSSG